MSGGDSNVPFKYTLAEANKVIQLAQVDRFMRRPATINSRDWDIPYLAGYSQDGRTIYIDRDLKKWVWLGKPVNTDRFLFLHEHLEKSVIDALAELEGRELQELLILLRMLTKDDEVYYHAHGVATCAEEYGVHLQYGASGLVSYNRFMDTQIKRAGDERIRRVPTDLDMTPYKGTDAKDVKLRRIMEARMAA
jgi:hypothetical protein